MEETGVANVADPLGGAWYVEALTDRIEAEAEAIFAKVRDLGRTLNSTAYLNTARQAYLVRNVGMTHLTARPHPVMRDEVEGRVRQLKSPRLLVRWWAALPELVPAATAVAA